MASGYYPPGAEYDTNAPYNEPTIPEQDFEVTCSQSLSRTVTVTTNDYIPGDSGVDYEPDGEGGYYASGWQEPDNTSETDWAKAYADNSFHTPLQLIKLLRQVLLTDMKYGIVFKNPKFTERLIKECEGWIVDDTEFVEE